MDYRAATADDAVAVASLHADSWRRHYRGAFSDAFLDGDVFTDRLSVWTHRLTHPGPQHQTIVAVDDTEVVGFAHTAFHDDPTWGALLDNLHVAYGWKRHGVGRTLMSLSARAVTEQTPPTGLYLWVLEQNTAAQAFYDAIGGRCVERGVGRPPGGGAPARLRYAWPDPSLLVAPG